MIKEREAAGAERLKFDPTRDGTDVIPGALVRVLHKARTRETSSSESRYFLEERRLDELVDHEETRAKSIREAAGMAHWCRRGSRSRKRSSEVSRTTNDFVASTAAR